MVATLPFLLSLAFIFTTATAQRQINISLGACLTPNTTNSSWLSPSGAFAFGFYQRGHGYAVGVFLPRTPRKTTFWTTKRGNPPVPSNSTLCFTSDGTLVLREQETFVAISGETAVSASFFDTGNFVLYNSRRDVVWQSFDWPTDTLLAGHHLSPGQQLFSSASESDQSTGIFRLNMQEDGNLVQYPVGTQDTGTYAYWAPGTDGVGDNVTLHLDNDGYLRLLNTTGKYVNNITRSRGPPKEGIFYLMRIDTDGIFRLYSYNATQNADLSIVWSSSEDRCSPMGLCGLNGFCAMIDQSAECECLPGFEPVNQGIWTSGCERNFSAESCMRMDAATRYTFQPVSNTVWEDAAYAVLTFSTNEECQKACLLDCNCEAVIYKDQTCTKQRLPLRYGRREPMNENILSIKVGKTGSKENGTVSPRVASNERSFTEGEDLWLFCE